MLDDLHYADEHTLLFLREIISFPEELSLLILGAFRNTELGAKHLLANAIADLRASHAFQTLSLGGLNEEGVRSLVGNRLDCQVSPRFLQDIFDQTEGNPFFVEEITRHLVETGVIHQHGGRWLVDRALDEVSIPEGVKAVIDRRLSRLSEECNSVLAIGSVIGREFDLESLTRASDLAAEKLVELLEEAIRAGLVEEVPGIADRYRFSHALVYETLGDKLTTTRRVRLHGQCLQYAERDGVKLAYEVLGGSGLFVIPLGLANSASIRTRNLWLARHWGRVSRSCKVVLYDRRGIGFSAAPERGYSLLAGVEDVRAVLDAVGAEKAVLWGLTDGGPMAIAFAVRYPERVAGLILTDTSPKLYNSEDVTLGINPDIVGSFLRADASDSARAVTSLVQVRHGSARGRGSIEVISRIPRHAWSKMVTGIGAADVRPLLSHVRTPTFIIHDPDNTYIPLEAAQYLHEHIPGSTLEVTSECKTNNFGPGLYRRIEKFFEEVSTRGQEMGDLAPYHFERTKEAFLQGDLEKASHHADVALQSAIDVGAPITIAKSHIAQAYVLHALGRGQDAAGHLEHALRIAGEVRSAEIEFNVLWAEAQFGLERGNEAAALLSLQKALAISKYYGYSNILMNRPAATTRLCAKALEAGIEVECMRELIRKQRLLIEAPPIHLENWPWDVKMFTLGRFRLEKEGKPVHFPKKAQQKPLSMLKALVAYGLRGKKASQEEITDALWPDSEGDLAHRAFTTTLHRLRKLLIQQNVVVLREGFLTVDPARCWVDAWAFVATLDEADAVLGAGPTEDEMKKSILLTENAIKLYDGPFLAGETEDAWLILAREQLRGKFLRAVERLGRHWENEEQWEKAIQCYQRGLETDEVVEGFYQRLMACYERLDRKAEGLATYNRCKKILAATFGVEPSSETEAIRKSLLPTTKS
jgi:DNA-binding SARP family transcriptional activator/pimeloyl-ACP methyl ester carboxylesterase